MGTIVTQAIARGELSSIELAVSLLSSFLELQEALEPKHTTRKTSSIMGHRQSEDPLDSDFKGNEETASSIWEAIHW